MVCRFAILVTLSGCVTDVRGLDLLPEIPEGSLTLRFDLCLEEPSPASYPVKVLFAIDGSSSLTVTDPEGRRIEAIREVVRLILDTQQSDIAILHFASSATLLTDFTKNQPQIEEALDRLQILSPLTNYDAALDLIHSTVQSDMQHAPGLPLARSRYVVIFLSDGLPNPVGGEKNTRESILDWIRRLRELGSEMRVGNFSFHTGFLPSGYTERPEALLRDMAEQGHGTFERFEEPEAISLLALDFGSFGEDLELKSVVVRNVNAHVRADGTVSPDSDGDGISDDRETTNGTEPTQSDSDHDGLSDLIESTLGEPEGACAPSQDPDGDDLSSCEENLLGSMPGRIDSDADGVPDGIEIRDRTDPLRPESRLGDGPSKVLIEEEETGDCYAVQVEGIRLVELPTGAPNHLLLYWGQGAAGLDADPGTFRVACLKVPAPIPRGSTQEIEIPREAFRPPEARPRDCVVVAPATL